VFHDNGELAQGAIAILEVQAYAVAAKRAAAQIAAAIGKADLVGRLEGEADRLQVSIDERFWCETIGTYALALDGAKRPCQVRTSNAGHLLYCGAALRGQSGTSGARLMRQTFCGWGAPSPSVTVTTSCHITMERYGLTTVRSWPPALAATVERAGWSDLDRPIRRGMSVS
jgi:glycogen debranching enzyme